MGKMTVQVVTTSDTKAAPAPLAKPTRVEVATGQRRMCRVVGKPYRIGTRRPDGSFLIHWEHTPQTNGDPFGAAELEADTYLGMAETQPAACTCNDCGECSRAKASAAVPPLEKTCPVCEWAMSDCSCKPPAPTPAHPAPIRREVWGGGQWLDYSRLGNAETAPEPFESFPRRREYCGIFVVLWWPKAAPDPGRAERPSDLAGAAAAALVSKP